MKRRNLILLGGAAAATTGAVILLTPDRTEPPPNSASPLAFPGLAPRLAEAARIEVVRRRDAFERDPRRFVAAWAREEAATRRRILAARRLLPKVRVTDATLADTARLCLALGTDGLRGELTLMRTARALAASGA